MKLKSTHFTNFGVSVQPRVANSIGYIPYREDFQSRIDHAHWTAAERWIDAEERRIDAWRAGN